ncbi:hypothetical protein ACFCV3_32405 [Kribbella sp. NPDC056345]|uniref:hypothetical protein n=1 Tax=Kribbella sp. NPDC056345 TaxID=3345789 RepID=UPI0035DC4E47
MSRFSSQWGHLIQAIVVAFCGGRGRRSMSRCATQGKHDELVEFVQWAALDDAEQP